MPVSSKRILKQLTPEQKEMGFKMFDLAVGRVLKNAYLGFDQITRERMDKIFPTGSDKEKEEFILKNIPKFLEMTEKEGEKLKKEMELQIKKAGQR